MIFQRPCLCFACVNSAWNSCFPLGGFKGRTTERYVCAEKKITLFYKFEVQISTSVEGHSVYEVLRENLLVIFLSYGRPVASVSSSRDPSPTSHLLLLSPRAAPHLPVFLLLPPSLGLSVSLSRSRLVTAMGGKEEETRSLLLLCGGDRFSFPGNGRWRKCFPPLFSLRFFPQRRLFQNNA